MGKPSRSQTTTTAPDAETQARAKAVWDAAQAAGAGGPGADAARDFYGNAVKTGNLGFGAMSGDPTAVASLMNPFQSQVMDRVKAQFGDLNALTSKGINDEATLGGAFGGSRHGVAEGVALGQNAKTAQDQIAQLQYGGYNDAMNRAGTMANFGMGAAGAGAQMDPAMMKFLMMHQGMAGLPYGSSVTQPVNRNRVAGALGGAETGSEIGSAFGPWGTGIGAATGGLMGLFG